MRPAGGKRDIRVGLLWHSPNSGNLGVGALTIANMAIARKAAQSLGLDPSFTIIGFGDDLAPYSGEEEASWLPINRRFLLSGDGFRSVLDNLDCVLDIGAGDSFTDIYGWKRLTYLLLSKAMAIAKRKPLLLSPQTIGPFKSPIAASLAAWPLNRAALVVARDPMSFKELRRIAPRAKALQSTDVAFGLPYNKVTKTALKPRIGLNISGLLFNQSVHGSNTHGLAYNYAEFSRRLLTALTKEDRFQVELISHVLAPHETFDDDLGVAGLLSKEFPSVLKAPVFASPSDAKSYISGLDFLVAGRMHACIAAFSSGVPFVATAYSRKFTGLFSVVDYPAIVERSALNAESVTETVLDWIGKRDELTGRVEQGMQTITGLLGSYEEALAEFFTRAVRSR